MTCQTISQKGTVLQIRLASSEDLSFVLDLTEKVFKVYGPYCQILLMGFLKADVLTLVAHYGEERVGFAMISPVVGRGNTAAKEMELSALAVSPKYQDRGAGRALLRHAMKVAEQQGACRMILHTAEENVKAHRLFLGEGFELRASVDKYYPNGQTALKMCRDLKME